jgi:membrane protease YdiL (CAAX protease family)
VASASPSLADWLIPGAIALAGGAALIGSLSWLAWRGIRLRAHLSRSRYRGPSVILLFFLALAAGNIVSVFPLVAAYAAGQAVTDPGPVTITALLLVTPLVFAGIAALFVVRPHALAGASLGDGRATALNLARGAGLGVVTWIAATVVAAGLAWLVTALSGEPPDEGQLVVDLAAALPPVVAVALVGLLSPVAEEFFFRWVAVNAWEREHGTRAAVIGSAILFAAAHLFGGSPLTLVPIFVLGLILGAAYVTTRSLPLVIGVHATFNCMSLAVLYLLGS